jgi:hypothetical protein
MDGIVSDNNTWQKSTFLSANSIVKSDSNYRIGVAPKFDYTASGTVIQEFGIGSGIAFTRIFSKNDNRLNELSLGVDIAFRKINLNELELIWPSQIDSTGFNPNTSGESVYDRNYLQLNTGINWLSKFSNISINTGYTLFSLNKPNISLFGSNGNNIKPLTHQLYMFGSIRFNKDFNINPRLLYIFINKGIDDYLLYGLNGEYIFSDKLSFEIGGGQFTYGTYFSGSLSIDKFRIGLAYNTSKTSHFKSAQLNFAYRV